MKIALVSVRDFKRIRDITIEPPADCHILVIGGPNANGKSSLLDAITVTVGGKTAVPADPVRHGAEKAEITVKLDNGLTAKRTIEPDGSSKLEVRDELGAVKSPQAVLDKLVAGRFLDPLAFLALKPADQRAELLRLIDKDGKIAELDARRDRLFDRRTELGRDLRKISAQVDGIVPVDPAAPVDIAALAEEQTQVAKAVQLFEHAQHNAERADHDLGAKRAAVARIEEQIATLQRSLADARSAFEIAREHRNAAMEIAKASRDAIGEVYQRRDTIKAEIASAAKHNEDVARVRALEQQRQQLAAGRDKIAADVAKLGEELATIDESKAAILDAAALPVPDLGVTAEAVTLAGVPLAQASGAERLRVALALAIAANPELRDVWVRDGALLDEESLAAVAEHARASGVRVWVERVGTRDPGAIVIMDGRVREQPANTSQGSLFA